MAIMQPVYVALAATVILILAAFIIWAFLWLCTCLRKRQSARRRNNEVPVPGDQAQLIENGRSPPAIYGSCSPSLGESQRPAGNETFRGRVSGPHDDGPSFPLTNDEGLDTALDEQIRDEHLGPHVDGLSSPSQNDPQPVSEQQGRGRDGSGLPFPDDEVIYERKKNSVPSGLINQSATCYLNSLMQALFMTPEFRNAIYRCKLPANKHDSLPLHLQRLFVNLQLQDRPANTNGITSYLNTKVGVQRDVQEFWHELFEVLEGDLKGTTHADLINDLYMGEMKDYVLCTCGYEDSRQSRYLDLPLVVKPFGPNKAYRSVEESLRAFEDQQELNGSNQSYCARCLKKCDATKGLALTKFPRILVLHLMRFQINYQTMQRIKLNDRMEFKPKMNLRTVLRKRPNDVEVKDEKVGLDDNGHNLNDTKENNMWQTEVCPNTETDGVKNIAVEKEVQLEENLKTFEDTKDNNEPQTEASSVSDDIVSLAGATLDQHGNEDDTKDNNDSHVEVSSQNEMDEDVTVSAGTQVQGQEYPRDSVGTHGRRQEHPRDIINPEQNGNSCEDKRGNNNMHDAASSQKEADDTVSAAGPSREQSPYDLNVDENEKCSEHIKDNNESQLAASSQQIANGDVSLHAVTGGQDQEHSWDVVNADSIENTPGVCPDEENEGMESVETWKEAHAEEHFLDYVKLKGTGYTLEDTKDNNEPQVAASSQKGFDEIVSAAGATLDQTRDEGSTQDNMDEDVSVTARTHVQGQEHPRDDVKHDQNGNRCEDEMENNDLHDAASSQKEADDTVGAAGPNLEPTPDDLNLDENDKVFEHIKNNSGSQLAANSQPEVKEDDSVPAVTGGQDQEHSWDLVWPDIRTDAMEGVATGTEVNTQDVVSLDENLENANDKNEFQVKVSSQNQMTEDVSVSAGTQGKGQEHSSDGVRGDQNGNSCEDTRKYIDLHMASIPQKEADETISAAGQIPEQTPDDRNIDENEKGFEHRQDKDGSRLVANSPKEVNEDDIVPVVRGGQDHEQSWDFVNPDDIENVPGVCPDKETDGVKSVAAGTEEQPHDVVSLYESLEKANDTNESHVKMSTCNKMNGGASVSAGTQVQGQEHPRDVNSRGQNSCEDTKEYGLQVTSSSHNGAIEIVSADNAMLEETRGDLNLEKNENDFEHIKDNNESQLAASSQQIANGDLSLHAVTGGQVQENSWDVVNTDSIENIPGVCPDEKKEGMESVASWKEAQGEEHSLDDVKLKGNGNTLEDTKDNNEPHVAASSQKGVDEIVNAAGATLDQTRDDGDTQDNIESQVEMTSQNKMDEDVSVSARTQVQGQEHPRDDVNHDQNGNRCEDKRENNDLHDAASSQKKADDTVGAAGPNLEQTPDDLNLDENEKVFEHIKNNNGSQLAANSQPEEKEDDSVPAVTGGQDQEHSWSLVWPDIKTDTIEGVATRTEVQTQDDVSLDENFENANDKNEFHVKVSSYNRMAEDVSVSARTQGKGQEHSSDGVSRDQNRNSCADTRGNYDLQEASISQKGAASATGPSLEQTPDALNLDENEKSIEHIKGNNGSQLVTSSQKEINEDDSVPAVPAGQDQEHSWDFVNPDGIENVPGVSSDIRTEGVKSVAAGQEMQPHDSVSPYQNLDDTKDNNESQGEVSPHGKIEEELSVAAVTGKHHSDTDTSDENGNNCDETKANNDFIVAASSPKRVDEIVSVAGATPEKTPDSVNIYENEKSLEDINDNHVSQLAANSQKNINEDPSMHAAKIKQEQGHSRDVVNPHRIKGVLELCSEKGTDRLVAAGTDRESQKQGRDDNEKTDEDLGNELTEEDLTYELFAILMHPGSTNSGHYYSYIKSFTNKKWYVFNDASVREVDETVFESAFGGGRGGNAYMLMYRQIGEENEGFIPDDALPEHLFTPSTPSTEF